MVFKLGGAGKQTKGGVTVDADNKDSQTADAAELQSTGKLYGVRSYLHQFYASPAEEQQPSDAHAWYLLPPAQPSRTAFYLCRAVFLLGLTLLLAGVGLFCVGSFWPKPSFDEALEQIPNAYADNGDIYMTRDNLHQLFHYMNNDRFNNCRMVSMVLMPGGAALLLIALLVPLCVPLCGTDRSGGGGAAGWSELDVASRSSSQTESTTGVVRVFGQDKPKPNTVVSPNSRVPCDVSRVTPPAQQTDTTTTKQADNLLMDAGEENTMIQ